jgi:hypothetical protein
MCLWAEQDSKPSVQVHSWRTRNMQKCTNCNLLNARVRNQDRSLVLHVVERDVCVILITTYWRSQCANAVKRGQTGLTFILVRTKSCTPKCWFEFSPSFLSQRHHLAHVVYENPRAEPQAVELVCCNIYSGWKMAVVTTSMHVCTHNRASNARCIRIS